METSDLIQAAIAGTWLALAAILLRIVGRSSAATPWVWLGVAFALVRAFDYGLIRTGLLDADGVLPFLDALILLLLVGIVIGAERTRRLLTREKAAATHAREEYGRALLDYTQLVRHRIANPLTAVTGGIETLLRLDLPESTRRQLLESMLESSRRLEQVALHPELISREEHGLKPSPAPLADPAAQRAVEIEGGEIESDFRDANEQLLETLPEDGSAVVDFLCECSARECATPITMSLRNYYRAHQDKTQFVVVPGHEVPAIEDVVHREDAWWIVRKRGPAADTAARRSRGARSRRSRRAGQRVRNS